MRESGACAGAGGGGGACDGALVEWNCEIDGIGSCPIAIEGEGGGKAS